MPELPAPPNTGKPETTSTAKPTAYVVLRRTNVLGGAPGEPMTPSHAWHVENSNVPAVSAEAAIRLACKADDNPAGEYVAVPAFSWKPVTVQAVQTTVLKLEEAS